jgi:hypothetical protein
MILVAVMVVWSWTSTAGAQAPGQESFVQHVSGDSPTTLYIKQPTNRHARTSAIQQKILQPKTTARLVKVQSDEAIYVQLSGQDLLAPARLQAPNEKNPSLGTPSPYDQVFPLPPTPRRKQSSISTEFIQPRSPQVESENDLLLTQPVRGNESLCNPSVQGSFFTGKAIDQPMIFAANPAFYPGLHDPNPIVENRPTLAPISTLPERLGNRYRQYELAKEFPYSSVPQPALGNCLESRSWILSALGSNGGVPFIRAVCMIQAYRSLATPIS